MNFENRIAGLVISYNPDVHRLSESINILSKQVERILIVDNGSTNCLELSVFSEVADIIYNEKNLGIAAALNIGMKALQNQGFNWVLTMDQDSLCSDNLIEVLSDSIDNEIGIVCPRVIYEGWKEQPEKFVAEDIKACMTSGSLTNVYAWETCGKFDESYFIDFVDNEFCMKLRKGGYRIIRRGSCYIRHRLGTLKKTKLLKIKFISHNANRYYYMTRNNLLFIKKYHKEIDVLKEYLKLMYIIGLAILCEEKRIKVIKAVIFGIRDYKLARKQ